MTGFCKACGETICVCTQDNKDAALELAKECGMADALGYFSIPCSVMDIHLSKYYNAARKPLEEAERRAQYWKDEHIAANEEVEKLHQQLLATQEAYQKQRAAVIAMAEDGWLHHGVEGMSEPQFKLYEANNANPPSLEMVERHDQELRKALITEIATENFGSKDENGNISLGTAYVAVINHDSRGNIAERKAKLGKMK